MTYAVLVRPSARRDIGRTQAWYEGHAPEQVARFVEQLAAAIQRIREHPHAHLVGRDFTADAANRLWLTDITEHWTGEGKLYLCAIKACAPERVGPTRRRQQHQHQPTAKR